MKLGTNKKGLRIMYYKLDEKDKEILKKAGDWTFEDYGIEGDFIKVDNLIACIESLVHELNNQLELYDDLQRDMEDNYRPISKAEQYDIHDSDFI